MARLSIKSTTIKALFAKSGNLCTFPNCDSALINQNNQLIAQVCHIEAVGINGERHNPESNDEYRRSYNNLIILCFPHHKETNDATKYSVENLVEMKKNHEGLHRKSNFKISNQTLKKMMSDMDKYWDDIKKSDHIFPELAMKVSSEDKFPKLIARIHSSFSSLEDMLEGLHESDRKLPEDLKKFLSKKGIVKDLFVDDNPYNNPFISRNWESHNLMKNNLISRIKIDLTHLEIKFLEEYLKNNPHNAKMQNKLKKCKKNLKEDAQTAKHAD